MCVQTHLAGGLAEDSSRKPLSVPEIEGLDQINRTVLASNSRAKNLYFSEGFNSFALEEGALKMGEIYYGEEQMSLRLFKECAQQGAPRDAPKAAGL